MKYHNLKKNFYDKDIALNNSELYGIKNGKFFLNKLITKGFKAKNFRLVHRILCILKIFSMQKVFYNTKKLKTMFSLKYKEPLRILLKFLKYIVPEFSLINWNLSGKKYLVPRVISDKERAWSFGVHKFLTYVNKRTENTFLLRFFGEILDLNIFTGNIYKQRRDHFKTVEENWHYSNYLFKKKKK